MAREPEVRLILVARREDRLRQLADELGGATVIAVDLTEDGAPRRVHEIVEREHGELQMLVNNAGAAWRGRFGESGWANIERHMKLNFEAPVRLDRGFAAPATRVRLWPPVLRACRSSTSRAPPPGWRGPTRAPTPRASSRSRPGATRSTAKSVSHGIHVGLVLPGFVKTEGFPATELLARGHTRWIVSSPERVAEAILDAGPGGKAERYVPRPYWLAAAARILAPGLVRRATAGGAFTTATKGG